MPDAGRDLAAEIDTGHQRLRALLVALGQLPPTAWAADGAQMRERRALLRELRREIAALGTVKERFLWPAVRRHLADGSEVARAALSQKQDVERMLDKVRWYSDRDPRADDLIADMITCARRHVDFENALLERLSSQLPAEAQGRAAAALRQPPSLLPTRPHPDMPTGPWAAAVLGPVVGLIDRWRDAIEPRAGSQ